MPRELDVQSLMLEDGEDDGFTSTEKLIRHDENEDVPSQNRSQSRQMWRTIAIHGTAILFYGLITVIFTAYLNRSSHGGQYLIYSPANEAVQYETRVFNPSLIGDPEYFGPPSPKIDSKWSDLMWPSSIHIAEEERQHYDPEMPIVQFPDGTYSGQLMVYHELHCLKRLYQYINADYYFPNLTQRELEMNKMHTEHCLGTLRQGIMCHGDVSVMPMVWGKHSRVPLGDFSNPHQCVDFDKLHAWAMKRAVTDALEPGVLVHPTLGPSFPDGVGTKIGFDDQDIDKDGNIVTNG